MSLLVSSLVLVGTALVSAQTSSVVTCNPTLTYAGPAICSGGTFVTIVTPPTPTSTSSIPNYCNLEAGPDATCVLTNGEYSLVTLTTTTSSSNSSTTSTQPPTVTSSTTTVPTITSTITTTGTTTGTTTSSSSSVSTPISTVPATGIGATFGPSVAALLMGFVTMIF